jgi:hypothetical protein
MAPRNSLREDDQPQEAVKGDRLTNVNSQRIIRLLSPSGIAREVVLNSVDSGPDSNGGYVDRDITNIVTDHGGNILPEDGPTALSHSGLYISSSEQLGYCTSILHPSNRPRTFLDGQDGHRLGEDRGRCSHCQATLTTIHIALGIAAFGAVIGLFRAVGLF